MRHSTLRLFLLRLCVAHGCGGCTTGWTAGHVRLNGTAGRLYLEFDEMPSGNCNPSSAAAAIADFSTGTLSKAALQAHSLEKHAAFTAVVDFGEPGVPMCVSASV